MNHEVYKINWLEMNRTHMVWHQSGSIVLNTIKTIKKGGRERAIKKWHRLPGCVSVFTIVGRWTRWVNSSDTCETAGQVWLEWVYATVYITTERGNKAFHMQNADKSWLLEMQTKKAPNILNVSMNFSRM